MPALDFIKNGIMLGTRKKQQNFHTSMINESVTGGQDEHQFCLHDSRQQR
jgi:hypothetical protein